MRTIGSRRPLSSPRGDYEAMCDICGTAYLRSELTRKNGFLYCRDDVSGLDRVEIAEAIQQDTAGRAFFTTPSDGGNFDHRDNPPPHGNRPLPQGGGPSGGDP